MQGETKEETKGETYQIETMQCSIQLNTTFTHTLSNIGFDYLPQDVVNNIMKDGRVFSHLIEKWISLEYPLEHIEGCQAYDSLMETFQKQNMMKKHLQRMVVSFVHQICLDRVGCLIEKFLKKKQKN